jgi:hypothetical protein
MLEARQGGYPRKYRADAPDKAGWMLEAMQSGCARQGRQMRETTPGRWARQGRAGGEARQGRADARG